MYDYLRRGALAGGVGGLAYGLYTAAVGNPLVAHAEQLAHEGGEHAHEHGHEHGHAHEAAGGLVTEGVTQAVSIGGGVLLGVLFGLVVFGVAAYLFEPALPDRGGSYLLALAGFLTVSGVPWLVLRPAAPGVSSELPVGEALSLYAGLVAVGGGACLAAGWAYHRLSEYGRPVRVVGSLVGFAAPVAAAVVVAPAPGYESALPATFEAAYLGVVVVGQLGLWGVTAAAHDRLQAPRPTASVPATAAD
jgi:predicted cobalt transporter CbtA